MSHKEQHATKCVTQKLLCINIQQSSKRKPVLFKRLKQSIRFSLDDIDSCRYFIESTIKLDDLIVHH
jgi:hypothetical protein